MHQIWRKRKNKKQAGGISLKVVFMGTPDFAVEALKSVIQAGHEVVCVGLVTTHTT